MIALCLAGASVIGLIVTYAWKVGATSYVVGSLDHLGPILIKNVARLPYFFEKVLIPGIFLSSWCAIMCLHSSRGAREV
eukprot:1349009-Amorphochlora_amoeboformis.AAC.1